jgi:hypothetical protein
MRKGYVESALTAYILSRTIVTLSHCTVAALVAQLGHVRIGKVRDYLDVGRRRFRSNASSRCVYVHAIPYGLFAVFSTLR